jgi:hypothetical protein
MGDASRASPLLDAVIREINSRPLPSPEQIRHMTKHEQIRLAEVQDEIIRQFRSRVVKRLCSIQAQLASLQDQLDHPPETRHHTGSLADDLEDRFLSLLQQGREIQDS